MTTVVVYIEPPVTDTSDKQSITVAKCPRIVAGVSDGVAAIRALRELHLPGVGVDVCSGTGAIERVFITLERHTSTLHDLTLEITKTLTGL